MSHDSQVANAPLRIVFPCHPAERWDNKAPRGNLPIARRAIHYPLNQPAKGRPNLLNLLNPLNLHTEGVSNGACRHRHLERGCVPLWETDKNRSDDALSREISCINAARTIREGDFSTPQRYGRNDGGRGPAFFIICARRAPPPPSAAKPLSPPERSDAQPFYTTRGASRAPFYNLRRSRHHHPRPERPSNLRTLRTLGP